MQAVPTGAAVPSSAAATTAGSPAVTTSAAAAAATPGAPRNASLTLLPDERQLFCTHTVASLKQIADDKRNQSDDKRLELRQLVGIRYRVLIDTADSIMEMQRIVDESREKYIEIQTLIPQLSISGALAPSSSSASSSANRQPSQLQLLLLLRQYALAPISIWSALDEHNYDSAIAIYLAQQRVAERLAEIEHWPTDSQGDHPQLKQLIDATLPQQLSTPSPSLSSALSTFFHAHSAYYLELPGIIAHAARERVKEKGRRTREYAEALAALGIVTPNGKDLPPVPERLLSLFLQSRTKLVHDLLWSAEKALFALASGKHGGRRSNPTPVLIHACTHVIYTLQHSLLDVALLFSSLTPSVNAHAAMVNKGDRLVREWTEAQVEIRVKEIQNKAAAIAGVPSTSSSSLPPFQVDASILRERVSSWLHEVQQLVSGAMDRLLPTLLQSRKACASFAELRAAILKAANWEDEESGKRESSTTTAVSAAANVEATKDEEEKTEEKSLPTRSSRDKPASSSSDSSSHTAAASAAVSRKLMMERWDDAGTIVFGRGNETSSGSGSGEKRSFSAPLSLFDLLFFSPLRAFSTSLVSTAFERLTLVEKVEEYLVGERGGEEEEGKKKEEGKKSGGEKKTSSFLLDDEDEEKSESAPESSPSSKSRLDDHSASQLHGAREDEVQEIVESFRRQMKTLGRECTAILDCSYVHAPAVASSSTASRFGTALPSPSAAPTPTPFPSLQRYLREELTPLLVKKYQTMIEKLVEQLKKKLTDLEQSVLLSMSNVTSWRSRATLEYVEQSVFISRVCHELVKQQQLMSLESILAQQRGGPNASTPRGRTSAVSTSAPSSSLSLTLSSTSRTAYRIWTRYIASLVAEDLEVEWEEWWSEMSSLSATTALGTQYEKQLFSNRSHLNGAPPLGLYLPVHPSGFISRLLFRVHHHYYRSYGYHIQSDILQALLTDVDQAVLGVVQGKVGVKKQEGGAGVQKSEDGLKRLSSASVLQLMFDVQFLFALLRLPPSTAASSAAAKAAGGPKALLSDNAAASGDLRTQYSSLLALFDAHLSRSLDQIDWVTSKPTFIANLHAAVTRSAVLYGVMAKTNPFPTTLPAMVSAPGAAPSTSFEALGGGGGGGGGQSAPLAVNIVPLAPVPAKILPLPTSLYPSKHPQPPTATSTMSSITATTLPSAATKLALASTLSSSGANGAASHSAASSHSTTASSTGLSFSNLSSNLSSQLSSVNTSAAVNAKAIGDLGSSLLGKLSSSTLWGKKQ